jgi:hypothetical protein
MAKTPSRVALVRALVCQAEDAPCTLDAHAGIVSDARTSDHGSPPLQLRGQLARERRELSLRTSPGKTLFYLALFLWRGLRSSLQWSLSHPVMLFLILPAAVVHLAAKHANFAPELVETVEVRSAWCQQRSVCLHEAAQLSGGSMLHAAGPRLHGAAAQYVAAFFILRFPCTETASWAPHALETYPGGAAAALGDNNAPCAPLRLATASFAYSIGN